MNAQHNHAKRLEVLYVECSKAEAQFRKLNEHSLYHIMLSWPVWILTLLLMLAAPWSKYVGEFLLAAMLCSAFATYHIRRWRHYAERKIVMRVRQVELDTAYRAELNAWAEDDRAEEIRTGKPLPPIFGSASSSKRMH